MVGARTSARMGPLRLPHAAKTPAPAGDRWGMLLLLLLSSTCACSRQGCPTRLGRAPPLLLPLPPTQQPHRTPCNLRGCAGLAAHSSPAAPAQPPLPPCGLAELAQPRHAAAGACPAPWAPTKSPASAHPPAASGRCRAPGRGGCASSSAAGGRRGRVSTCFLHALPQRGATYRGEACNLVAEALALNDSNLLAHALVGGEVHRQPAIILLDDDPGGLLDGLGAHTTLQTRAGAPQVSATPPCTPWRLPRTAGCPCRPPARRPGPPAVLASSRAAPAPAAQAGLTMVAGTCATPSKLPGLEEGGRGPAGWLNGAGGHLSRSCAPGVWGRRGRQGVSCSARSPRSAARALRPRHDRRAGAAAFDRAAPWRSTSCPSL